MDLTVKQRELLTLLAQGLSAKEAAARLGVAPNTVSRELERARLRNGCASTLQLMWKFGRDGSGC